MWPGIPEEISISYSKTHLAFEELRAALDEYGSRIRRCVQVRNVEVSFHADLFRQSRNLRSDVDVHAIERIVPVTETEIRDAGLIISC